MQLPADQELILLAGFSPIKALKIRYFSDRNFTDRVLPPFDTSPWSNGYPGATPPSLCDWDRRTRPVDARLTIETEKQGSVKNNSKLLEPKLPEKVTPSKSNENVEVAKNPDMEPQAEGIQIGQMGTLVRAHGIAQTTGKDLGV